MVDARAAHIIDARIILAHTHRLDQSNLSEVRREFAQYLSTRHSRASHTTWQGAWNDWTGATPHRSGQIRFHTPRCPECKGRGFSHRNISRNIARTGHPSACFECGGTRRGKWLTVPATYITPPETVEAAADADTDSEAIR
jgi:hypothetical protein